MTDNTPHNPTRRHFLKMVTSAAAAASGKVTLKGSSVIPSPSAAPLAQGTGIADATLNAPARATAGEMVSAAITESAYDNFFNDPRYKPILDALDTWKDYRAFFRNKDAELLGKLQSAVSTGTTSFSKDDVFFLANRLYGKQGADAPIYGELLKESRALIAAAPSRERIYECMHHPVFLEANQYGGLTRGDQDNAARELNAIARMDEGQLMAAYEKEVSTRAADLATIRDLLGKLPALQYRVAAKAKVTPAMPEFGTIYRAGESPIPTDYYAQAKPASWSVRLTTPGDLNNGQQR